MYWPYSHPHSRNGLLPAKSHSESRLTPSSYGELADQAAKAAFAKQFQRDRAKLAAMGIAIESRQPEYSSKSEGQDFASYRLQLGDEPRIRLMFEAEDMPVLAAANYLARSMSISSEPDQTQVAARASRTTPRVPQTPIPGLGLDSIAPRPRHPRIFRTPWFEGH